MVRLLLCLLVVLMSGCALTGLVTDEVSGTAAKSPREKADREKVREIMKTVEDKVKEKEEKRPTVAPEGSAEKDKPVERDNPAERDKPADDQSAKTP